MLYMKTADGELRIVVLETGNLEELRKGRPATAPDGSVLIAWTPAPKWLAEQIQLSGGDGTAIARAIEEAVKRPQEPSRPSHGHVQVELRDQN